MQITPKEVMVLTPDGDFIKIRKEKKVYELGKEITIVGNEPSSVRKIKNGWKLKTLVAVIAALLLFVLSFIPALLSTSKVSAYVSMDVTSSIELGITADLQVVKVKGINQEGKQIVKKLNKWQNRDMEKVINEIITLNERAGHLKANPKIIFSTVMVGKENAQFESSLQKKIRAVEDTSQVRNTVDVEMKKATIKDREEASDNGISTGTYLDQSEKKSSSNSLIEDKVKEEDAASAVKARTPATPTEKQVSSSIEQSVNQNKEPAKDTEKKDITNNSTSTKQVAIEKTITNIDENKKREEKSDNNVLSTNKGTKGEGENRIELDRIKQNDKQRNVQQQNASEQVRIVDKKTKTHDKPTKKESLYKEQPNTNPKKGRIEEQMEKGMHDQKQKDSKIQGKPDDHKRY